MRWRQFSLRTLLIGMLVACCFLGWVAYKRSQAAEQQAAFRLILDKKGACNFGPESSRPAWLRWILGDDVAAEGGCLEFSGSGATDADVARLCSLQTLQRFSLGSNPITDQGVRHLETLPRLKYLSLDETKISDAALQSLQRCKSLEFVSLYKTQTTPAAVQALRAALPNLNVLDTDDNDLPPLSAQSPNAKK